MRRIYVPFLIALLVLLLGADSPAVDSVWPDSKAAFARGPGGYLAVWKILSMWFLFAMWAGTTDWMSRDSQQHSQNYALWNPLAVFTFLAFYLLIWLAPWGWYFYVGYFLLIAAYAGPLGTYIYLRNKHVSIDERVLTKRHLRYMALSTLNKVGFKFEVEEKSVDDIGPKLKLIARGGATDPDNSINLLNARRNPAGYLLAREILADALLLDVESIQLDFGGLTADVRYSIDGFWHSQPQRERAKADEALFVYKTIAALNPAERGARQQGQFGIEFGGKKYDVNVVSGGVKTGETVILTFVVTKPKFKTLEDIGMRPKMEEQLLELTSRKAGYILVTTMPGGGLTTLFDTVLKNVDRFIKNFVAVENAQKRESEIENVGVTTFEPADGEDALSVLPKLVRTYPDVLVIRDLTSPDLISFLCGQVKEGRMIYSGIRSREAVEALLRVLMIKVPPAEFAAAVTAVLNARLVRKLCDTCKEKYPPPADVLQKFGLPAGRIEAFYRTPTQPIDPKDPKKVCEACRGIGYRGRTMIFELLTIDDAMRQIMATQPKLDLLRAAARKARHRTLQEEGVLMVARGVTSLEEVVRVLKT